MSRTCQQIQDDGLRCSNPAMYRRQVCYHHWRLLRPSAPVSDVAYVPPTFDCEASVSIVTANILRSLFAGKITPKFAQSAMTCVREMAKSLRLQGKIGKAGDRSETRLTPFMADYYSTLDQIQAKSAAAFPDPQPLIYPAHLAEIPEEKLEDEEMNDVEMGRANMDTGFQSRVSAAPAAQKTDHHDRLQGRGRAGLQPRVADAKETGALAPAESPDKKPLSATQLKLVKKILRRGPKHPQFHLAARLLDRQIATTSA